MKFLLTILLIISCVSYTKAQQNDFLPQLVVGSEDNIPAIFGANHLIVGCYIVETGNSCPQSFTITDANGHIPSITMKTSECITNGAGNHFDSNLVIQPWYGLSTSAGILALTPSPSPPRLAYENFGEFTQGTNLTFDNQSQFGAISPTNPSLAVTTAKNNDLITSCMATGDNPATSFTNAPINISMNYQSSTPGSTFSDLGSMTNWAYGGFAGSFTTSYLGGGGFQSNPFVAGQDGWGITSMSFKANNITIGTSKLANCYSRIVCYERLRAFGGGPTYTWSVSSGSWPSGCSNSSLTTDGNGDGIISCTPIVGATTTFPIVFQVTDGTNTTTRSLNFIVGAGVQTISFRNVCTYSAIGVGPCGTPYQTGDVIHIINLGDDTHGAIGRTLATDTTILTDSCGDLFKRSIFSVAHWPGAIVDYYTTATCSNSGITYNGNGYDPLSGITLICTGCQETMDDMVITGSSPGNVTSTTLTKSVITHVPNTRVLSVSIINCSVNCSTSTSSPFTLVAAPSTLAWFAAYMQDEATPGTYSATTNFSNTNANGLTFTLPMMALIPIRPEKSDIASGSIPHIVNEY